MKKKLLILADYFFPGYKAGGPIQSLQNFCYLLKEEYSISVITRDTDLGEEQPFQGIESNTWASNAQLGCRVYYCSKEELSAKTITSLIENEDFDFLYLNSLFSQSFTFPALKMIFRGAIKQPIVLAPRGELNTGALAIKRLKKKIFLKLMEACRVPNKIIWQGSNEEEAKRIREVFGSNLDVRVATNVPSQLQNPWESLAKKTKEVRILAISRMAEIKNIDFFLRLLQKTTAQAVFDIYGPIEDQEYWQKCKQLMEGLPKNVKARYCGELNHHEIIGKLTGYHFFVSPSKGENFGHSIFEAMLAGKPVLISDCTPWRNLEEQKVGWDISLHQEEQWLNTIQQLIEMQDDEYALWSKSVWNFAKKYSNAPKFITSFEKLFS